MLDHQEFDVAELSLASYATLVARDASPFVAIPVMLSKLFRHSCIYVRRGAGIERPQDLKGKRVGTTQYGATAIVYIKGMLKDEYGITPEDLRWFIGGLSTPTEPPLVPLNLPDKIELEFLTTGQTLEAMFADGQLDALFAILLPAAVFLCEAQPRRSRGSVSQSPRPSKRTTTAARRSFPSCTRWSSRRTSTTRIPFVAASLYRAFCESRDRAIEPLYDTDALMVSLPFLIDHIEQSRRVFGNDFWAYGLEPNRPSLDALCRYVHEQGLAPRRITPDELFVPVE